jgi:hypothetical protein
MVSSLQTRLRAARSSSFALLSFLMLALAAPAGAQMQETHDPQQYGPYNGAFLADGLGLRLPLANANDSLLRADAPWTMVCWFRTDEAITSRELVAGLGDTSSEYPRFLAVDATHATLWMGAGNQLSVPANFAPGAWHLLAASFDGERVSVFVEGKLAGSGSLTMGAANPALVLAPPVVVADAGRHFGGWVAGFTVLRRALSPQEVQLLASTPPESALTQFEAASKPWPLQTRQQVGYRNAQAAATLPTSRAPLGKPVVKQPPPVGPSLRKTAENAWTLAEGWQMREAPRVDVSAEQLSSISYHPDGWLRATVPGTVLTTLVDDGVYPDPDFGLNNLAIPESLNKQDYWYRNEFTAPPASAGPHASLTFQGINYRAEAWLNGARLGEIKGAFMRGTFDVSAALRPGEKNVLAVRISPPPHPGLPQEESFAAGPGENGGVMALDGPTFAATEGWDWIPTIRDRDTGLWQPVTLTITRGVQLGDAQVVTSFPNHDTTHAAVAIHVPVINSTAAPVQATVSATLEQIALTKTVTLPPGASEVSFTPQDSPQLLLDHPRLWWPNGYGAPNLYHLQLAVSEAGATAPSDTRDVRFGVREVSYELSLMDGTGHLRRVEYFPTEARGGAKPVVDVSHEGMLGIPSADAIALNTPEAKRNDDYFSQSHVASITRGEEHSPALRAITDDGPAPYLVIKVNGVRIAARGGNWGMDDSRKRVSREHLEPYFRLHRDAHLNIIRNWVGQNTEESFYELADEYGLMVWNDFWESTENYNAEAEDPALFLANAADTIKRFRNHPSIVMWCGRNEGVPQPILNRGLDDLTRTLDGTRYYSPSSNALNLQNSGPYSYQDPKLYFAELNRGFSVETGTPSLSTLESLKASIPAADQWPIDDVWAYHDWHQAGNGDVHSFMAQVEAEFGAPTGIEDFERKAQMLNYVDYRAIFEGMNANLWSPNSGRMLWMTQPAWPSNHWQILSSDYDTHGSFYGVKKACEPVHVQLNLATYGVDLVNTTQTPEPGVTMTAKVYSLANALLYTGTDTKDLPRNARVSSLQLALPGFLARGMVLVQLELHDASGKLLSQNLYWLGEQASSYRELTTLPPAPLTLHVHSQAQASGTLLRVELTNTGTVASLANKLTLLSAKTHARVLPAYFSDNYISLLPGQSQTVEIDVPGDAKAGALEVALRGWNTAAQTIAVAANK